MKNILITGVGGFIGFNVANYLLKKNNFKIIGVDNLNDYYSVKLKKDRLKILRKSKKFYFYKYNIEDKNNLFKLSKHRIDYVLNFAAQAGVRYSIKFPRKYLDSNITGFFNILEFCKINKVKKLIYASSSSVYGENKIFPLKENFNIKPKNFYGYSKKNNEEMADIYSNLYGVKSIGLRFFTVYGEWGRPDMMIVKFISSFFKKQTFNLYNYGNHTRDFTYVGDVVEILQRLLKNNKNLKDNDVLNICSNKPINLKKIISFLIKENIKPKIKKLSIQKADILKTHGDNSKLFKYTKFKNYSDWKVCLKKVINWYQNEMI